MSKLYQVIDDHDILHIYCTTTDYKVAKKVLLECLKTTTMYTNFHIRETVIDTEAPTLTFLFMIDLHDASVYVEDGSSDFREDWSDAPCFVIKAKTLKAAKKELLKKYNIDYDNVNIDEAYRQWESIIN